jgi:hypothetical protein
MLRRDSVTSESDGEQQQQMMKYEQNSNNNNNIIQTPTIISTKSFENLIDGRDTIVERLNSAADVRQMDKGRLFLLEINFLYILLQLYEKMYPILVTPIGH